MNKTLLLFLCSCGTAFSAETTQPATACLDLSTWPTQTVLDLVAQFNDQNLPGFHFTDLDAVNPDQVYTSNSIFVRGLDGETQFIATGGINAHFILNGVSVGAIIMVRNGDTLALRTYSEPTIDESVQVTVTAGCMQKRWRLVTRAQLPIADTPGPMAGSSKGDFQVSESGAATYSVPITGPPGIAGMAPKLALTYSSHGRNNLLGNGWGLSGLSLITRCPATLAQDGFNDGVNFNELDRFCLDGERLMLVGGAYGAPGSEYRTEQNTFQRVRAFGRSGVGPRYFIIETKSGLTLEYGRESYSRIEASGREDVLYWALNKMSDSTGNFVKFQYWKNTETGEYLPTRIDYTGNDVTGFDPVAFVAFSYEDKPDAGSGYVSGSLITSSKRLTRIITGENEQTYRAYLPSYEQSDATGRSRLASIRECGSDGSCFDPLRFEYTDKQIEPREPVEVLNFSTVDRRLVSKNGYNERYTDLNGDGLPDKAWIPDFELDLWVALGNGAGFEAPEMWLDHLDGLNPYSNDGRHDVYLDMNHDGRADKVWVAFPQDDLYVALSTGNGFETPQVWLAHAAIGVKPFSYLGRHEGFADVNGDGRPDRLWVPDGLQDLYVSLSTGIGFETPVVWLDQSALQIYPYSKNGLREWFLDVNADGMADRIWLPQGLDDLYVALSTSTGFTDPEIWLDRSELTVRLYSNQNYHDTYADLNGDGLLDKAWIPDGTPDLWVALGNGSGFNDPEIWLDRDDTSFRLDSNSGRHEQYVDLNGDGYSDRIWIPNGLPDLYVAFSNGRSFDAPVLWTDRDTLSFRLDSNAGRHEAFVDIDGNGIPDRVWVPNGINDLYVAFSPETPIDLLQRVIRDEQVDIQVDYLPLTNPAVYAKGASADFPELDFISPLPVVRSYRLNNGIGGTNLYTHYYSQAKIHLQGRGFRGFAAMLIKDQQTNMTKKIYYDRRFECINGKIRRIVDRQPNGAIISDTLNNVVIQDHGNGIHYSYIAESLVTHYDLDGSLISRVTTEIDQDSFGNVLSSRTDHGGGHVDLTTHVYADDETRWFLGRMIRAETTRSAPGEPDMTRTMAYIYNPNNGLLIEEIMEPDLPHLRYSRFFSHDAYGNVLQSDEGDQLARRGKETVYDASRRYVVTTYNEVGHAEHKAYFMGNRTSRIGPNGLETTWDYDGFGRNTRETRADGTVMRRFYRKCVDTCPPQAVYFVKEQRSGAGAKIKYFDFRDRPVREQSVGLNGTPIYVDTAYDTEGRVRRISEPYFQGDTPIWTFFEYDLLGRNTKMILPGDRVARTVYSGKTKTVFKPGNKRIETLTDERGQVIESIDENGGITRYFYNPFGDRVEVQDTEGNIFTATYNLRGQKLSAESPDSGLITYQRDALGQLISQTDANGQTTNFTYDDIGRVIRRQTPEGISSWAYDTAESGVGRLATETSFDGVTVKMRYDLYGRLDETRKTIDGFTYIISHAFDQYGRESRLTNPSGFSVSRTYDPWGNLTEVRRTADEYIYWRAETVNASGQIELFHLGNGVRTHTTYDQTNSLVLSVESGLYGGNSIQDLQYDFDLGGNLILRRDLNRSLSESFFYDGLERLVGSQVAGQPAVTIDYSPAGNIRYKSDVGNYTYGQNGAGPHAVTSITGIRPNTYAYDLNGNRVASNGGTLSYTSFNKPRTILHGSNTLEFAYDNDLLRVKQVKREAGVVEKTKYYVGSTYERILSHGQEKEIHYIFVAGRNVAAEEWVDGRREKLRYFHRDHLGSIQAVSDEAGHLLDYFSYDPWGARRDPDTWSGPPAAVSSIDRGFTGHEMLDEAGLIHMNGRLYDPTIGRMLSPDPFTQSPKNGQSFNQYSYALNNPLSSVDPSGFFFKKLLKLIKKILRNPIVRSVIAVGIGVLTGGAGAALFGSIGHLFGATAIGQIIGSAAGFGFGSSFSGTLLAGGRLSDALKTGLNTALISGLSAAVTLGLVPYTGEYLSHGIVQGTASWAEGGSFEHGFLQGVVGRTGTQFGWLGKAVAGGTAAEIGGGKFANGAAGAAFQSYLADHANGNLDSKVAYVGGVGDNLSGSMKSIALSRGYAYFTHDDGAALQAWISSNKGRVTIIAHSWGGDTAASIITDLSMPVDLLITLDPVSWIRPDFALVNKNTVNWVNFQAVGGSSINLSNIIARIGGAWRGQPKGFSNHMRAHETHGSIVNLFRTGP